MSNEVSLLLPENPSMIERIRAYALWLASRYILYEDVRIYSSIQKGMELSVIKEQPLHNEEVSTAFSTGLWRSGFQIDPLANQQNILRAHQRASYFAALLSAPARTAIQPSPVVSLPVMLTVPSRWPKLVIKVTHERYCVGTARQHTSQAQVSSAKRFQPTQLRVQCLHKPAAERLV